MHFKYFAKFFLKISNYPDLLPATGPTSNNFIMKRILFLFVSVCFMLAAQGQNESAFSTAAALQLVKENKEATGLTDTDLNNLSVSSSYTVAGTGMTMVYLQQTYKGLPVFNRMKVLAFREGKLVSNAGTLLTDLDNATKGYTPAPKLEMTEAIRKAFAEEKLELPSLNLVTVSPNGRVFNYGKAPGMSDDITAELFWFPQENAAGTTVKLVWQVQVSPPRTDDVWHYRIDALSGQVVDKFNITIYDHMPARPRQTNSTGVHTGFNKELPAMRAGINGRHEIPESPSAIANATYNVIPYPIEAPSFGAAALRSNPWTAAPGNATSLGWHSDGVTDYTISRGNNVYATEDTLGVNNNSGLPATSTTGPDPLTFNFTPNYTVEPSLNPTMQQFCITNLFYWNNIIHDITYQYGFDEVSGNFQANNQGRGGVGNDRVMALAQSGNSGHIGNNANFTTGADGGTARMRMYLFDSTLSIFVNSPASVAGAYAGTQSIFSTNNRLEAIGPVTGQLVYYNDPSATTHEACTGPPSAPITGKIALIDRGNCNFTQKVLNAQNAGAIAVIMVNNVAGYITMAGSDNTITIPAVLISQADGALLAAQLANNISVTLSATGILDGDLDNGVITHEYGHGISNRLTGGPSTASCLQNAEQGGEGWSDYFGLMLTTNWAAMTPSSGTIPRAIGSYLSGQHPSSALGFRNYPYTTDMTRNPLTYAHMGVTGAPWLFSNGSQVHNIGEIICSALWEMTWAIIQQENSINPNLYNFSLTNNGGNTVALKLVIEGLRLQPCLPGYVDVRNAILAADRALYGGRYQCAIWTAFAKRGLGYSAQQGLSSSTTDQTAAFDLPPAPTITTQPSSVTVNPGDNTSFTVAAQAPVNGAGLLYLWQVSTNNGSTWNNIVPFVTTPTLSLTAVTSAMNGYMYRCIIAQGCAFSTSNPGTLTVFAPSGFTFSSPAPATAACPAPATMDIILGTTAIGGFSNTITVAASTPPAGTTVSFIPSASVTPGNNVTVRLTGTNGLAAGSYTITITGTATGATTQTRDLTYTITPGSGPAISAQPANQALCAGGNTSFSITSATATGFQWQVSTDGGSTWTNISNGGVYSGATSATLTITGATGALNNNRYRCVASTICGNTNSNAGILTVNTPPAITSQPASASVCVGATQVITVGTTGSSLTYQWHISTDGGASFSPLSNGGIYSGATTASLTITGVSAAINNYQYRCVITGICPVSPITSNAATITVATALSITGQPTASTICAGNNTSFSVTAVGAGNYQWQVSTDGGSTWTDVTNTGVYSGATTATLNITGATTALNGNRYRCNLSSGCGNATSNAVLLTVNSLPAISAQPANATLCAGANNTFTVTASGSGISYQWQISTNGCAGPWTDITGATNASYTLTAVTTAQNNTAYRCVVTGTCTPAATSNCALLTVVAPATVTTQPSSQTICEGSNVSFTSGGSGTGVIYQWQVSTDGGTTWTNVTNGGVYSGATTATLSITSATFSLNNNRYRCQVSNATCTSPASSNAAILTVNTLPAISTQPQSATVCTGSNANFSVTATGTGITYQWQVSNNGCAGPWTNISGATNASYSLAGVTTALNNTAYRCIITGTCTPAATSACALLTVGSTVSVTGQPADQTVCSGSNATFTVTGSGTGILYQWQVSTDGGTTWTNITGATTASYTESNTTTAMTNRRYRCQLSTATCTVPATSGTAQLTVRQLPTVTLIAAPLTTLTPGQITTLTATPSASTGGTLSVSWLKDGNIFTNAGNTFVADIAKLGAYQVRIQETFAGGLTCSNQSAVVTIGASVSSKLFIFPSPNNGQFKVSYYNNGGTSTTRTVTVFDSKGAKVYNARFPVAGFYTILDIDLRPAQQGIYYVVVGDANGTNLADGKVLVGW